MQTTTIPAGQVIEGQMVVITTSDGVSNTTIVREVYSEHQGERTINMHTFGAMTFVSVEQVTVVTEL